MEEPAASEMGRGQLSWGRKRRDSREELRSLPSSAHISPSAVLRTDPTFKENSSCPMAGPRPPAQWHLRNTQDEPLQGHPSQKTTSCRDPSDRGQQHKEDPFNCVHISRTSGLCSKTSWDLPLRKRVEGQSCPCLTPPLMVAGVCSAACLSSQAEARSKTWWSGKKP